MTSSTFRIPRLAAAVLMLGGAACDGSNEEADASRDINTSSARIRSVSRSVCEAELRCDAADFSDSYPSLDDCTEERVDTFPLADQSGEDVRKCQDAILDLAVCISKVACPTESERQAEKCRLVYATYEDTCEGLDEDHDDELDPSFARSQHLLRQFRIPR